MHDKRHALIALAGIAFGLLITIGSAGELAVWLFPSLMPDGALGELHRPVAVRLWVLVSNVVTLGAGPSFALSGIGLLRGSAWARGLVRGTARIMLAVALGSALVCAGWVLPPLVRGLEDKATHAQSLALIVSIAAAMLFAPLYPTMALLVVRRAAPRGFAARQTVRW